MQKKNEAILVKQAGKSSKNACPAPLGPPATSSLEMKKESLLAQQQLPAQHYQNWQGSTAPPHAAASVQLHPLVDPNGFMPCQNGIQAYDGPEYVQHDDY